MAIGLLGLKVGMTQVFDEAGKMASVTVLELGPCPVLQVRTVDRDGYHAVQLGFKDKLRRKAIRCSGPHRRLRRFPCRRRPATRRPGWRPSRRARALPPTPRWPARRPRPVRWPSATRRRAAAGSAISTGRGFTGVMKRHNFQGLPAAHGAKKVHRSGGSISSHASNRGSGRPKKGHKAAGQYGNSQVTIRNLDVVRIDAVNHLLLVRGAVPGPNGGLVVVRPTNKKDQPDPEARKRAEAIAAKKKKK